MSAPPPAAWEARRLAELRRYLDSFDRQFTEWKARTETDEWATHYNQVRAIEELLLGVKKEIEAKLAEIGPAALAQTLAGFEELVLSGWRVWEFFRSKLGQRQEAQFRTGLRAADELAWACRGPLAQAAAQAGKAVPKEPALVYLNGDVSPAALARGRTFWAESEPGMKGINKSCNILLKHVPVPVISLPWHEVFHPPSLGVVAHEAGHVIEEDFQLAAPLAEAIARALAAAPAESQLASWQDWRAEVFADFFAVRHCGPSYLGVLTDVLIGRVPDTKKYPPNALRIALCLAGLDHMGLNQEALARRGVWEALEAPIPAETYALAAVVVRALAEAPLPNFEPNTLAQLIAFGPRHLELAQAVAKELAKNAARLTSAATPAPAGQLRAGLAGKFNVAATPEPSEDAAADAAFLKGLQATAQRLGLKLEPRVLVAAARLAYEEQPSLFAHPKVSAHCLALIGQGQGIQRRGLVARRSAGTLQQAIREAASELLAPIDDELRQAG